MKDAAVPPGAAASGGASPLNPHADAPQRSASTDALDRQTILATRRPTMGSCHRGRSRHLETVWARRVQTRQRRASSWPSLPARSILLPVQFPMATCLKQWQAPNELQPAATLQEARRALANAHDAGSAAFVRILLGSERGVADEEDAPNHVPFERVDPIACPTSWARHR